MSDATVHLLPLPSGVALTADQARRATCLAVAFALCAGRAVPHDRVWAIARWIETGEVKP